MKTLRNAVIMLLVVLLISCGSSNESGSQCSSIAKQTIEEFREAYDYDYKIIGIYYPGSFGFIDYGDTKVEEYFYYDNEQWFLISDEIDSKCQLRYIIESEYERVLCCNNIECVICLGKVQ